MNKITKIARVAIAVAVLVLGVLLVACQTGDPAPDSIYFAKEHTPRKTYVKGQELDFTDILLTCDVKGEATTVAMDSPDVTVGGYDKDTLGAQTVTVTYKEKTTSFQVTVIPRISVEGYDANYFVGDSFNKQNGRIRFADDNATISTVNLKDDSVTITNFDSSTTGTKQVTVSYKGYSDTFNVNILGVESVKLNSPSKKSYQSHETDFSVAGGYLTVTSEGGVIKKTVPVTMEMISGFDPTAATMDNRTAATALKQTVKIEYLGHSFDMEISIRYSGVSIVKQYAEELENVDATTISKANGDKAMDAIREYFELSKADQALLTKSEVTTVARLASVYAYDCFLTEAAKYDHTFTLSEGESKQNDKFVEYCGYFTISCQRYDDMVATLEALKDDESEFNVLADFLHTMEKEFKNFEVTEGVLVDAYFKSLFLEADLTYVTDLFKQMVAIYEELQVVPENWDRESIKDAAMVEGIEDAYMRISTSNFSFLSYPEFYAMISSWRAKNDFYEIIHTHYLYNKTYGENESYATQVWEKIPFPGDVQTLYANIANGFSLSSYMNSSVYDTTTFMVIYRDTVKLVEEIKNHENTLYSDVYEAIDFDDLVDGYLYSASTTGLYGYLSVIGNLRYNEDVLDLIWNDYFALVDLADEEGLMDFENPATAQAVQKMFEDFFSLTPYERYQIICSLYSNYCNLNVEGYAFDYSEGMTSTFIHVFAFYYAGEEGVLPKSTHELFQKLMIATEQYGIRYKHLTVASGAVDQYLTLMEEIVTLYNGLSAQDKATFDQYVGVSYQENLEMYNKMKATAPAISTYPMLEELKSVLDSYYGILAEIAKDSEAANTNGTYALLFAAYEKANSLQKAILASNDQGMIEAYRFYNYLTLNANDESDANDYKLPLESVFDAIKVSSYGYTLTVTKDDETKESYNAIEYYTEGGLATFFADSYKVLYTHFAGGTNSSQDVLALMNAYRGLDEKAVGLFYSLNLDACYYAAVEAFFAAELAQDAATAALATALLEAEQAYASYWLDTEDAEALAEFKEAWEAAATAKDAIGTATANYDELLKTAYEYYLVIYNGLNTAA